MKTVVGISFEKGGKVYYFDPNGIELQKGQVVIVESAKGQEAAHVAHGLKTVDEREIKGELKPVVRVADGHDLNIIAENEEKKPAAIKAFKEKIEANGLKMKAVDANFAFDNSKLTFFYTAEGRVDFRNLVKDLATHFRKRIELRQIFESECMKMSGIIASCGRQCCCAMGKNHNCRSTIKMAKAQGMSLASQKVAGMCGKLMCCLSYESHLYEEVLKKMPKIKARVKTPDGEGQVESQNILKSTLRVRVDLSGGGFAVREYSLDDVKKLGV
jgi:cell fate regulator YaaT (PSP1 superfamily)